MRALRRRALSVAIRSARDVIRWPTSPGEYNEEIADETSTTCADTRERRVGVLYARAVDLARSAVDRNACMCVCVCVSLWAGLETI